MRPRTRWALGLLALTVLLAGCKLKRLEDEISVTFEANVAKGVMELPVQTRDMQIKVTATSPGAPVALYLVPTAKADEVMNDLDHKGNPSEIIARAGPGETVSLEGTVPANQGCTVVALSDKKGEVKAKIVGRY